jgi:hypothetical protein
MNPRIMVGLTGAVDRVDAYFAHMDTFDEATKD